MSPSLPSRRARSNAARSLSSAVLFTVALFVTHQATAQNTAYSTHDWVVAGAGGEFPRNEAWVDVKSPGGIPGNRFIYTVGTANLQNSGSLFSNQLTAIPPAATAFALPPGSFRQVAVLQVVDDDSPGTQRLITWQRYFFGNTPGNLTRATNARAVSVWREPTLAATRVAICGETYDQSLPLSQAPGGWAAASAAAPSGYIAVYDGAGTLLWTHHFFAGANGANACAITDVSIRVENGVDVVTYCGISSHGLPAAGTELSPLLPFAAPGACNGGSPGTPAGQWDGIVGRVVFNGVTSTRTFHSIVGGPGQDGLFGISEIDMDRFAVVGSAQAATGASGFPFTTFCGAPGPYTVGTALIFDATATRTGGNLALTYGDFLGTPSADAHTIARDVHIGLGVDFVVPGGNLIYVVGSTDDPNVLAATALSAPAAQATLNGPTDGFLISILDFGLQWTGSFHGGAGNDGLTGVNGWNEFGEHISVTGFTDDGAGGQDIDCGTYFLDASFGPAPPGGSTALPSNSLQMHAIRRTQVGGTNPDLPAVMGAVNASTAGLFFNTFGLGQESGGGVAVGPTGRTNVAGRTLAGGGYPVVFGRPESAQFDAVRTELDMVPPQPGVPGPGPGRTDGTGFQPIPAFPTPGTNGGTTPACALSQFGRQIGMPLPTLPRMLIDYQGALGFGSTNGAILLCRPTPDPLAAPALTIAVMQLAPPPALPGMLGLVELWNNPALPVATFTSPTPATASVFRLPIVPLTITGLTFTVQVGSLVTNPVGPGGACSSVFTGSPAIFFSF